MKKNIKNENFLEKTPFRNPSIKWSAKDGKVTLEIENIGFFNRLAQKLLKKPKISYVHLDKLGSFLWPLLDGNKNIITLGELLQDEFNDEVNPLYERLAKFFQILESYQFIVWK